jgi:hypothetical protein
MLSLVLASPPDRTYLPFLAFFSPIYLAAKLADSFTVSQALIAIAPIVYMIYAVALVKAAAKNWGPACLVIMVFVHHGLVVWLLGTAGEYEQTLYRFQEAWGSRSGWILVATCVFLFVHIGALCFLQYQSRRQAMRPRQQFSP